MISGHALALCGYQFITCVRVQWRGETCPLSLSYKAGHQTSPLTLRHTESGSKDSHVVVLLRPECSDFSPPVTMMLMIFLCMEALLFLTFTAVMFSTQLHSICNDETVRTSTHILSLGRLCVCVMKLVRVFQEIERLKNEKPTWERQTRWAGLRSVFGGQPSLMWISPFAGLKLQTFLSRRSWRGGAEFSV